MKLFEYIDRINLLHKLIKERKTGSPEKFAKRLLISTSRLYVVLDDLKLMGAPICYSRKIKSYYYCADYEISVKFEISKLDGVELLNISAGCYINNYSTTFFM